MLECAPCQIPEIGGFWTLIRLSAIRYGEDVEGDDVGYSIGEFSEITGLTIDTLRFYEKQEIIRPDRDDNNRRVYGESDIAWIEFVLRLKRTGMSLAGMKRYAELRYQGDATIPERMRLLFNQLEVLHAQQDEIVEHIKFVEQKIRTYARIDGGE